MSYPCCWSKLSYLGDALTVRGWYTELRDWWIWLSLQKFVHGFAVNLESLSETISSGIPHSGYTAFINIMHSCSLVVVFWTGISFLRAENLSTITHILSYWTSWLPYLPIFGGIERKSIQKWVNGFCGIGRGLANPCGAWVENLVCWQVSYCWQYSMVSFRMVGQ